MTQPSEEVTPSLLAGAAPEVLGRLLAAHTVLQRLPDGRKILEFVVHALKTVPGVTGAAAWLAATELLLIEGDWGEERLDLPARCPVAGGAGYTWHSVESAGHILGLDLGSVSRVSGCLYLLTADQDVLEVYLPFLTNLAGSVALTLDNLAQRDFVETANKELRESQREYELLFQEMASGFAVHELIVDEQGRPADYRFLTVNKRFEELTGLRRADILGRTAREVLPGLEQEWIEAYGKVVLQGEKLMFDNYSAPLDRHFEVVAYSPSPGKFATIFIDITERKKHEESLSRTAAEMEAAYLREHEVAEQLQKALLPEIPELPGLEIEVVYESATDLSRVGGDFYDVVPLGDKQVMVVVGDVCGKGLPAAKRMAMVRHTLRAVAADRLPAGAWLIETNRRLAAVDELSGFVTVALIVLDLEKKTLEYSLAGHPPPFLACSDGLCVLDLAAAPPLGTGEEIPYGIAQVPIHSGDVLLVYTDGLFEARHEGRLFGIESLPDEAGSLRDRPFSGEARRLVESARSFSRGELHDDTVVFLLRLSAS